MSEVQSRRGRVHDAEGAREAILNAAEQVFAEHGFDGARTDVIAEVAGYNKSLISAYFDGKLGLYAAVIRRADEQTHDLQVQVFATLDADDSIFTVERIKSFLREFINAYFDYLVAHPRFMRILLWEMAEGWQTYGQIITQRDKDDVDQVAPFMDKLQKSGLLRSSVSAITQFIAAEMIVPSYIASLALTQLLIPAEAFSTPAAQARAREYIVEFVIHGLIVDPPEERQ